MVVIPHLCLLVVFKHTRMGAPTAPRGHAIEEMKLMSLLPINGVTSLIVSC